MRQPGEERQEVHLPGALFAGPHLAGHSIQCNEERHALVIDQQLVPCTPGEYRVLLLLLDQANHCVPYAQLLARAQGEPLTEAAQFKRARTRLMHLISDVRAKVWAFDLDIAAVMHTGYILLSSPVQEEPGVAPAQQAHARSASKA